MAVRCSDFGKVRLAFGSVPDMLQPFGVASRQNRSVLLVADNIRFTPESRHSFARAVNIVFPPVAVVRSACFMSGLKINLPFVARRSNVRSVPKISG